VEPSLLHRLFRSKKTDETPDPNRGLVRFPDSVPGCRGTGGRVPFVYIREHNPAHRGDEEP